MLETNSVKDDPMLSKFSLATVAGALFKAPAIFSVIMVLVFAANASAQFAPVQAKSQTETTSQSADANDDPLNQKPWTMTGRIHLQKGTNKGYLVLQLDLQKGYYSYSVNPKASPAPTTITMAPSADIRMLSKFESDKPPEVIEKDPVFQQRIEKHKGKVQFFASIEVRPGVDVQKLAAELEFKGQICSQESCQPIRGKKVAAKFAGHFELPKTDKAAATQAKNGTQPPAETAKR